MSKSLVLNSNIDSLARRLLQEVVPLWVDAGVSSRKAVITLLEMLAMLKHDMAGPRAEYSLQSRELNSTVWGDLRSRLAHDLRLPIGTMDGAGTREMVPGLLEHTRRATVVVAAMTGKDWGQLARAILLEASRAELTGRLGPTAMAHWLELIPALVEQLRTGSPNDEVYCPFATSSWLPLYLSAAGSKVVAASPDADMARVGALLAQLGGWSMQVRLCDPITRPFCSDGEPLGKFATTVGVTDFGLRLKGLDLEPVPEFPARFFYGEARQLALMVAQTQGMVLAIVPDTFLARPTGAERDLKDELARQGWLRAVVTLPGRSLKPRVEASLLVVDTTSVPGREVTMLDLAPRLEERLGPRTISVAASQIAQAMFAPFKCSGSTLASYDDLKAERFALIPSRYAANAGRAGPRCDAITLDDVATFIRPQSLVSTQGIDNVYAIVCPDDVADDGNVKPPAKRLAVADHMLGRAQRQHLMAGDVLLSVRGRCGLVASVPTMDSVEGVEGWLASHAFVIIRTRSSAHISSRVLAWYLTSAIGQEQLRSLIQPGRVSSISVGDIRGLSFVLPTPEQLQEIDDVHTKVVGIRTRIAMLETAMQDLKVKTWPVKNSNLVSRRIK